MTGTATVADSIAELNQVSRETCGEGDGCTDTHEQ